MGRGDSARSSSWTVVDRQMNPFPGTMIFNVELPEDSR